MRVIKLIAILALSNSCTSTFYQVYTLQSETGLINKNAVIFEDHNISITYDLWSQGGNPGFSIYNKTDQLLDVHLEKCFYIYNGTASPYFKNRTYSEAGSVNRIAPNRSVVLSQYSSATMKESESILIPQHSRRYINEYKISGTVWTDCSLPKYPSPGKQARILNFNQENTPLKFYNQIEYSIGSETYVLKNDFFVSEITNLHQKLAMKYVYDSICGELDWKSTREFDIKAPNKFYIEYKK